MVLFFLFGCKLDENNFSNSGDCLCDVSLLIKETYGNVASGSSEDDEDWTDMVATKKRKSSAAKAELVSSLGPSVSADGTCGSVIPRRRGRPKADHQLANGSPAQAPESSRKSSPGGSSSSKKRPPYKRLDEAVTQVTNINFPKILKGGCHL